MAQDFLTRHKYQTANNDVRQAGDLPVETAPLQTEPAAASGLTFSQVAALLSTELPSETSRRVYRNTFQQWEKFAAKNEFEVMDLHYDKIKRFLYSRNLSYSTRLSRKSHMQRLLRVAAYIDPSFGIHYIQLSDLRIRGTSKDNAPRRKPRQLSLSECRKLLSVWQDDDSHMGIRNYAVICLLLNTAVSNSELVALRWEDLDWDQETLVLEGDYGDRDACVPIRGNTADTINALRRLQSAQRSVLRDYDDPFSFMFPALSTGMYARFKPEKTIRTSTQTIRNIVKQTAERAGLGKLTSVDLRHTRLGIFADADVSHADNSRSAAKMG